MATIRTANMRSTTLDKLVLQVKKLTGKTDIDLIQLLIDKAKCEVELEVKKPYDSTMDNVIVDIAVVKLNKLGNEGLSSTSASGMSDNYLDGYPISIIRQLNSLKGKVKIL